MTYPDLRVHGAVVHLRRQGFAVVRSGNHRLPFRVGWPAARLPAPDSDPGLVEDVAARRLLRIADVFRRPDARRAS